MVAWVWLVHAVSSPGGWFGCPVVRVAYPEYAVGKRLVGVCGAGCAGGLGGW